MSRKFSTALLGVLAIVLAALVVPLGPPASAAPAPWTWKHVERVVSVAPNTNYAERIYCPAGYTAISGGLKLPTGSTLLRRAEFRDFGGAYWEVNFRNDSASSGTATVVAECASTADLPTFSYQLHEFPNASYFDKTIGCPNSGEVVVTAGTGWDNPTGAWLYSSGPGSDGASWRVTASGANVGKFYVEIYCVDPAQVPGLTRVEKPLAYGSHTVTCPLGTRVLNGGNSFGVTNGSHPHLNTWTVAEWFGYYGHGPNEVVRAWCVAAGNPTVSITGRPSAVVNDSSSNSFSFSGSDPAGFGNGFRCSLDGAAPQVCGSFYSAGTLATGPHLLTVFNQTGDGRQSSLARHDWIVDGVDPTANPPAVPPVTLGSPPQISWTATDQHSSVGWHDAAYWRVDAAGVTNGWVTPIEWSSMTSPSVTVPSLAPGETICISVRARDQANNLSPWTQPRCTSRPLDDRALTAGRGWSRGTGTQYWEQTITSTTAAGQKVKLPTATLDRVGVVATVCPRCGRIDVAVGGTVVRRVKLERATTAHKKVILLPAFSLRTGAVRITTVDTEKSVRIDGLVTVHTTPAAPS